MDETKQKSKSAFGTEVPDGSVGFMFVTAKSAPPVVLFKVDDLTAKLKNMDDKIATSGLPSDPSKSVGLFTAIRTQFFGNLDAAMASGDQAGVAMATVMLTWCIMNEPGQADQMRSDVSKMIGQCGRAAVLMATDGDGVVASMVANSFIPAEAVIANMPLAKMSGKSTSFTGDEMPAPTLN